MNAERGDKWLSGLEPTDPIGRAAHVAIENRLDYFWHCLKRAAKQKHPAAEDVHQARVSARRAMAALETFEPLLSRRHGKWIQKQVKRVRRAAGEARDDDVLIARLLTLPVEPGKSDANGELPFWRVQLEAERALHQIPIRRTYRKLKQKDFRRRVKQLASAIKWREESPEPCYRDAAIVNVREMAATLESTLLGVIPQEESLHPLRIAGKRLRYALELFKGAFTTPLLQDEIYPQVETLQNLLGEVNDHVSAIERIEFWLESSNVESTVSDLQQLLHEESTALDTAHAAFDAWWQAGEARLLCLRLQQLSADSAG